MMALALAITLAGLPPSRCPGVVVGASAGMPVLRVKGTDALLFHAGLAVTADGAPDAYHPDDRSGLDALANAGRDGRWWALATQNGTPVIQKGGRHGGYYVSTTALEDKRMPDLSPARYVDATRVPYIALPSRLLKDPAVGVRLGDLAAVRFEGRTAFAIVADSSSERMGIGSIALAKALGIPSNPRGGGIRWGGTYLLFPRSGNGQPRPAAEIEKVARRLLAATGGAALLDACPPPPPPRAAR